MELMISNIINNIGDILYQYFWVHHNSNWQWFILPCIVLLDFIIGDPVYKWHPVRIMGYAVQKIESFLFAIKLNTRLGGVLLVLSLILIFLIPITFVHAWLWNNSHSAAFVAALVWDLFWGVHFFALRDLIVHVQRISLAIQNNDVEKARIATSMLVGRDTKPMDLDACGRAGIESLSENLVDGVISPLLWYTFLGLPGLILFKIASTLDSMVGYKNDRYFYFGWAGARLDDLLNYLPARFTWLATALIAAVLPQFSGKKAYLVGLTQHARAPGPNSGYSETAFAGALAIRIAGPIWKNGQLVTTIWLGLDSDPPGASPFDMQRAITLAIWITLFFTLLGTAIRAIILS